MQDYTSWRHDLFCMQGVGADSDMDLRRRSECPCRMQRAAIRNSAAVPASRRSAAGSMGMPVLLQARPTPPPIGVSRMGLGAGASTQNFQAADMERLRKTAGKANLP